LVIVGLCRIIALVIQLFGNRYYLIGANSNTKITSLAKFIINYNPAFSFLFCHNTVQTFIIKITISVTVIYALNRILKPCGLYRI